MYAITGVTGHVGGAAARALLDMNQPVRAVVRDPRRGGLRATAGTVPGTDAADDAAAGDGTGSDDLPGFTQVAVADFGDRAGLAAALRGCDGAFVLLPTIPSGDDAAHRELAGTISGAVADSAVPHVVALSSYGAESAEGNGPVRWLHHFENLLRGTGARVTVIRSPHFQEKVEEVLAATGAGIYPVFGESADVPMPMVATRDIGAAVADALVTAPQGVNMSSDEAINMSDFETVNTNTPSTADTLRQTDADATAGETDDEVGCTVVDLEAPEYTERQVAEALGAALGRRLEVVIVPRQAWISTWTDAGMDPGLAAELAELYEATAQGRLVPTGDRSRLCTTGITETLSGLITQSKPFI